jgi:hypothetical protein
MKNVKIYHNTFYGIYDPTLIGLPNNNAENSGNEFKNNIIFGTNGTPTYTLSTFTISHNASDDSLSGDSSLQTLTDDPAWDAANDDFRLAYNTTAGANLGATYETDMLGNTRTTWSRGALEYVSPITPPSGLAATASGPTSIGLSWVDESADETGFSIERSLNGSTGWTEVADLAAGTEAWTDTGLSPGTAYYYRVAAYNEYGSSAYSDTANDTTDAAPVVGAGRPSGRGGLGFGF